MPERWAVAIEHPEPQSVLPHHLHALVSKWLDADHWAQHKPYSLVPLYSDDTGSAVFEIGALVAEVGERLASGVAEFFQRGGRLGQHRCAPLSPDPHLVAQASWTQMWDRSVADRNLKLQFETATTFRKGSIYYPVPIPSSAVRSWNERWKRYAPDKLAAEVDLDASRREIVISQIEGTTIETSRNSRTVTGFVGTITYTNYERGTDADSVSRRLAALASVAEFAGTGSLTTQGFGVTSILTGQPGGAL